MQKMQVDNATFSLRRNAKISVRSSQCCVQICVSGSWQDNDKVVDKNTILRKVILYISWLNFKQPSKLELKRAVFRHHL